mmetsp:Transcript_73841/g.130209  ORF Transcript_73841/g.130209 Transcript_73841/m.130209 type:complete len:210 (+) Transcript_73841:1337-1966(+)
MYQYAIWFLTTGAGDPRSSSKGTHRVWLHTPAATDPRGDQSFPSPLPPRFQYPLRPRKLCAPSSAKSPNCAGCHRAWVCILKHKLWLPPGGCCALRCVCRLSGITDAGLDGGPQSPPLPFCFGPFGHCTETASDWWTVNRKHSGHFCRRSVRGSGHSLPPDLAVCSSDLGPPSCSSWPLPHCLACFTWCVAPLDLQGSLAPLSFGPHGQ